MKVEIDRISGDIPEAPATIPADTFPQKLSIRGIVTMDETGFWFYDKKVEDAGEAHRAFLEAFRNSETAELCNQCDKLREALKDISAEGSHARSGSTAYRMAVIARTALQEDRN